MTKQLEKCALCVYGKAVKDDAGVFFICKDHNTKMNCVFDMRFSVTHCLNCAYWKKTQMKYNDDGLYLGKCYKDYSASGVGWETIRKPDDFCSGGRSINDDI